MRGAHLAPCCVEREVATRLQRARAVILEEALESVRRAKSLERAQEIARNGIEASRIAIRAMDGVPMPEVDHDR
jgi:hypothetical protein